MRSPEPLRGPSAALEWRATDGTSVCFLGSFHTFHDFVSLVASFPQVSAVAVELSAPFLDAMVRVLGEVAPREDDPLPGTLGLAHIPPECGGIVKPLHFVPIVATDSICAAVRRFIGKVPLYGVDLDEDTPIQAGPWHNPGILPDPALHIREGDLESLGNYVRRWILPCSDRLFDPADLHFRARNLYAAGRLAELVRLHAGGRILMVCGMAHIGPLMDHLRDPETRPIPPDKGPPGVPIQPVVLPPSLAARYLDRFPRLAHAWEVHRHSSRSSQAFHPRQVVRSALASAYRKCLDPAQRKLAVPTPLTLNERGAFERLLLHASAMSGEAIPTLATFQQVVRATARHFESFLLEALLEFPYASRTPLPYPELKVLPFRSGPNTWVRLGERTFPLAAGLCPVLEAEGDGPRAREDRRRSMGRARTFPPDDRMSTALAVKVAHHLQSSPEEDEGEEILFSKAGMAGGIDIRRTLRRMAAGKKDTLCVRERTAGPETKAPDPWPFPILFVFSESEGPDDKIFSWYGPFSEEAGHGLAGKQYHGLVAYGRSGPPVEGIEQADLRAVIHFQPMIWSEPDGYQRGSRSPWEVFFEQHPKECPVGEYEIEEIFPILKESPRILALLKLALKHTRTGRVTVVLADSCSLVCAIEKTAAEAGKKVHLVPASFLPARMLDAVRRPLLVPWIYEDSALFLGGYCPPATEYRLGLRADAYKELDFGPFAHP